MAGGGYTPDGAARRGWSEHAGALAGGSVPPRALLERGLEVLAAREHTVRAFAALDLDGARAAADAAGERWARGAPLSVIDGCPVGVKDIIATRGLPTAMGSALYAGWSAPADAACVAALRAAGAVVVGKMHTTEFAVGESPPTTNPWDAGRTPGGSSSGSAAAVGCGMVPVALGSQTVGSILRPASFCGAVGYKPTHGALPLGGIHPLATTLDHLGPIAASVADAWAAARVIRRAFGPMDAAGGDWPAAVPGRTVPPVLARVRIEGDAALEAGADEALQRLLAHLAARGARIVDASAEPAIAALEEALAAANACGLTILRYEMRWPLAEYAARAPDAVGPRIREHLAAAASIDAGAYAAALDARAALREAVVRAAPGIDGFVLASASGPAPEGLGWTGDRTMLAPWSVVGGPAWSLPLMALDGLPFGLQLAGAPGADAALAGTASWLMGSAAARGVTGR